VYGLVLDCEIQANAKLGNESEAIAIALYTVYDLYNLVDIH